MKRVGISGIPRSSAAVRILVFIFFCSVQFAEVWYEGTRTVSPFMAGTIVLWLKETGGGNTPKGP